MRSFESTGPDVKIRGTPSHIAEKYVALARDALSSGDPVLAENYLQHAEHYNRIILSYREQMAQGGMDPLNNGAAQTHNLAGPDGNDGDEFGDDEGDEFGVQLQQSGNSSEAPQQPYQQPQRNFDNQNRDNQNRYDRQPRNDQRGGFNNNHNNRNDRGDGQRFDRNDNRGDRGGQDFRGDRHDRNGSGGGEHRFRDDRRPHNNNSEGQGQQGDGGFRRRDRYQGPNGADRDPASGGFQPSVNQQPATAACNSRRTSGTCAATGAIACGRAGAAGFPSPTGAPSAPRRARSEASASSSTGYNGRPGLGQRLRLD